MLRTLKHPAAAELQAARPVVTCDDLYESMVAFDDVYSAIADRVLAASAKGSVVYAVPGSAVVGERAVHQIRSRATAAGISGSSTRVFRSLTSRILR